MLQMETKEGLKVLYTRVSEYKEIKILLTSLDASTKRCMVQFHGVDICINKDVLLKEVRERIDEYYELILLKEVLKCVENIIPDEE